jgi:hypothetical protein
MGEYRERVEQKGKRKRGKKEEGKGGEEFM